MNIACFKKLFEDEERIESFFKSKQDNISMVNNFKEMVLKEKPTFYYGPVLFTEAAQYKGFTVFFDDKTFKYSKYSNLIPCSMLLNPYVIYTTWENMLLTGTRVFQELFKDNEYRIFIKADLDLRIIPGTVIDIHDQGWEYQFDVRNIVMNERIFIAPYQDIIEEYRVITNGELFTISRYKPTMERVVNKKIEEIASSIYEYISKDFKNIPIVLDIALTKDGLKLIEINSFSCAGWYECDLNIIRDIFISMLNE